MTERAEPGIDFARLAALWVVEWRLDEAAFWRTMTPARVAALYEARTPRADTRRKKSVNGKAAQGGKTTSLLAYMQGR